MKKKSHSVLSTTFLVLCNISRWLLHNLCHSTSQLIVNCAHLSDCRCAYPSLHISWISRLLTWEQNIRQRNFFKYTSHSYRNAIKHENSINKQHHALMLYCQPLGVSHKNIIVINKRKPPGCHHSCDSFAVAKLLVLVRLKTSWLYCTWCFFREVLYYYFVLVDSFWSTSFGPIYTTANMFIVPTMNTGC